MGTILFDSIVFGPIISRRLGVSLGINLLPPDGKLCSFNCIYCECGLNEQRRTNSKFPTRTEVKTALEAKLKDMSDREEAPDVITFAGNGEPTLHPAFAEIIDDTIELRNKYFPKARIAVLSNSTTLHREDVFKALNKIDDNILKLDSVSDMRIQQLDVPNSPDFTFDKLLSQLIRFDGNLIIQTMFLKGEVEGESVDNTSSEEIDGWLEAMEKICPRRIMIYTIDRETPFKGLKKLSREELEVIAEKARKKGFDVQVSG
ncbi:MAG: radical SAM protein [Tannerellaceae bacterium]|nr:radical SAM protein [Tannerellaceae bacterium]